MSCGLSLWALPAPHTSARLERILLDLAGRHAGPRFLPHLTLFAGQFRHAGDLLAFARERAARTAPFSLPVEAIETDALFYKCVFLRLGSGSPLEALSTGARAVAASDDHVLDPHLSLFYGVLDPAHRHAMAASVALETSEIRFSELLVNASPGRSGTPAGVEAWAPLLRLPLSGS